MRHKDINLLMLPFPMWAVFEFCKTLLSSKLRTRFSVHSSLSKLVTKLGAADILPQEYGGTQPLHAMARQWVGELHIRRSSLLGKEVLNIKLLNYFYLPDLDSMRVSENIAVEKAKGRKRSLWGLFSGYGGCED